MSEFLNKKISFPNSKISVKIFRKLYHNLDSKIFQCHDVTNQTKNYCIKILQARSDDKPRISSINTEIIVMMYLKGSAQNVQIIDYYSEEKYSVATYFILMEFCGSNKYNVDGNLEETRRRMSGEKNCFTDVQIWKIIYEVAQGIKALHALKYSHRDIKLDNVLISMDGKYKLSDYGSVTNKFYETVNNSNRNEIVFDVTSNTSPSYRAPEQLNLYSGFAVNEKVDIWCFGIMLYILLFDCHPFPEGFRDNQIRGNLILTEEMVNQCNPHLIELLKSMMQPNPKSRLAAEDIVLYIEKNWEAISKLNRVLSNKRTHNFSQKFLEITSNSYKKHSTQYWVLQMTQEGFNENPSIKYLKLLINKAWLNRNKIIKVFQSICARPIHYFSVVALRTIYLIHHYIFLGPNETLFPQNFNLEEFLLFFENLWNTRCSKEVYDKDDHLKNSTITKFIVSYCEFLRAKINYHKKYYFVGNNYSLNHIKKNPNFDYFLLVDKKFISDTLALYSLLNQRFVGMPLNNTLVHGTMDIILQALNEEIISMFNFIFFILVAYKHEFSKEKNEKVLKLFDSSAFEITNKCKTYMERFKKFRNEINSQHIFIDFPQSYTEYIKSLDEHLRFFPVLDFNARHFFLNTKDISGIRMNRTLEEVVLRNELLDPSIYNNEIKFNPSSPLILNKNISEDGLIIRREVEKVIASNNPIKVEDKNMFRREKSTGFNFSEDKFQNNQTNFDFEVKKHASKRSSTPCVKKVNISGSDETFNLSVIKNSNNNKYDAGSSKNNDVTIDDIMETINRQTRAGSTVKADREVKQPSLNNVNVATNQRPPTGKRIDMGYDPNLNRTSFSPNVVNMKQKTIHENPIRLSKKSCDLYDSYDNINQQASVNNSNYNSNVFSVLNEIFDSNKPAFNQIKSIPVNPNNLYYQNNNNINSNNNYNYNDPNKYNQVPNNNIGGGVSYNNYPNQQQNYIPQRPMTPIINQVTPLSPPMMNNNHNNNAPNMTNNNQEWYQSLTSMNNNPYLQSTVGNTNYVPNNNYPNNNYSNNNLYNLNPNVQGGGNTQNDYSQNNNNNNNNSDESENKFESVASQFKSDISNINIYNIQNNINNINLEKLNIEQVASNFLCKEFSKSNLQWLISSRDVVMDKQIGFGGTSEVYKANYRGTDVAVKKLRILEVSDEALKEFKREVTSLIMLRHPNLVLFMGAIAEENNICIVTEYCAGGTLFSILHQRRDLIITWELRLRILLEIAVGMNFLHTNNPPIIHRDLKSLNLLLTEKIERPTDNTKIKISDFGLSKIIRHFDSHKQKMTGQLGTCHWMAPEVIENKDYSIKADIYSFGIIIWEICTRKTPYADMTQQQISYSVTVKKGRPDKSLIPPNTPPLLVKLMETCWDHEPNNRPSFAEIIEFLKKIKL